MTVEKFRAVDKEPAGQSPKTNSLGNLEVERKSSLKSAFPIKRETAPGNLRDRVTPPPPPLDESQSSKAKRYLFLLLLGVLGWNAWRKRK